MPVRQIGWWIVVNDGSLRYRGVELDDRGAVVYPTMPDSVGAWPVWQGRSHHFVVTNLIEALTFGLSPTLAAEKAGQWNLTPAVITRVLAAHHIRCVPGDDGSTWNARLVSANGRPRTGRAPGSTQLVAASMLLRRLRYPLQQPPMPMGEWINRVDLPG